MTESKPINDYKKDIVLIIVGALLGSMPVLISTYLQGQAQLHQIIFAKKLSVLKEYSTISNKFVSDILPKLEDLEARIVSLNERYTQENTMDKNYFDQIIIDGKAYTEQIFSIFFELNTQILIINALFKSDISIIEFPYHNPSENNVGNMSDKERIEEIKNNVIKLKKITVEQINKEYKMLKFLSSMID